MSVARLPVDGSVAAVPIVGGPKSLLRNQYIESVPSTRASGQHRVVTFRWTCDKKLRDALVDFAQDSVRASPWADQLYRRHRQAHKTHPHAARIVTRAWIGVIWRCWQDHQPYTPARHRALQRVLAPGGLT